jgi:hypothetical protein
MSDPHFSHTKPRLSVNVEAAASLRGDLRVAPPTFFA